MPERDTPPLTTTPRREHSTPLWKAVSSHWPAGLVLLHIVKVATWLRELDFASPFPIVNFDYIQYYARALRAHEFLTRSGRFWGYDPFDGAGVISGPFEVGSLWMSLIAHALSGWISISRSILIIEIAGFLLVPLTIIWAIRNFGGTKTQSWIGFGLTVLLYGAQDGFSYNLVRAGIFGYQMAAFLVILQVSLFWRYVRTSVLSQAVMWGGVSAVLFLIHPAAIIVSILPHIILFLVHLRRLFRPMCAVVLGGLLFGFALNWFWIHPFLHFRAWMGAAYYFTSPGLAGIAGAVNLFRPTGTSMFQGLAWIALAWLAFSRLQYLWKHSRGEGAIFVIWILFLVAATFFGSFSSIGRSLQPYRIFFPLTIVLIVLASFALENLLKNWLGWDSIPVALGVAAICLGLALGPGIVGPRHAIFNSLSDKENELIAYIQNHGPFDGRLLIETAGDIRPNYLDMMPLLTRQALVGGPNEGNFLQTRFSLFAGTWFDGRETVTGRPLAFKRELQYTAERTFAEYLELYNVVVIAAWSPVSIRVLNGFTETLDQVNRVGGHNIYRVKRRGSWLAEGSGDVQFDYDRLIVKNASPGKLIIKFHWLSTFAVTPPLSISPIPMMDDPLPFIEIDNPQGISDVVIENVGLPSLRGVWRRQHRPESKE